MVVVAIEVVLYVVVVVDDVVCNNVPPENAVYQRKVPVDNDVAVKDADPVPQMLAPVTVSVLLANR